MYLQCDSDCIQYLLQVDVLIDDSLVPLGIETLACMFGPPLVFSTRGTHHSKINLVTEQKKLCRLVDHHNAMSTIYWNRPQYDSRGERMNAMHIVVTVTMYGPTCIDGRLQCQDLLQKSPLSCPSSHLVLEEYDILAYTDQILVLLSANIN